MTGLPSDWGLKKMFQDRQMDDAAEALLLKLGVTLAVPLAAYIISSLQFRTADGSSNNKPPTGNRCNLPATFVYGRGLKDVLQVGQNCKKGVALFTIIPGISATPTRTTSVELTPAETGVTPEKFSCCSKSSEIAERLLLHENHEPSDPSSPATSACSDGEEDALLLQDEDVNLQESQALISVINEPSAPEVIDDGPLNAEPDSKDVKEEEEFACLSNVFQSLWERDTLLQIQTLECHGRKEHEDAIRDLENRLRVSGMEAEHLQAKVESLQQENEMLNLQVSQYLMNMEELESEKAKAKHLKRKLKSERTQARANSGSLEQRIGTLQEKLQKMEQDEAEARSNLERLRGVEAEVAELRMRNLALSRENLDLTRRLESAQAAAISCSHETSQEANRTREASGRSENKIEQLQADHIGDEEFMYLRWLSARLRYETKKHVLLPWKTKRRSKSKSPESENDSAKLPFDDSSNACIGEKNLNFGHLNMEFCYSPEGCNAACDGTTIDKPPPLKRETISQKPKFFRKVKKLLTRKSSGENNKVSPMMMMAVDEHPSGCDPPDGRESVSTCSIDSMASGFTVENSIRGVQSHEDDNWQSSSAWIQASYKSPRNVPKARMVGGTEEENNKVLHCMSDLGASINLMRMANEGGKLTGRESQPKILGR